MGQPFYRSLGYEAVVTGHGFIPGSATGAL